MQAWVERIYGSRRRSMSAESAKCRALRCKNRTQRDSQDSGFSGRPQAKCDQRSVVQAQTHTRRWFVAITTLLAACAHAPEMDTTGVQPTVTPAVVLSSPTIHVGTRVQWGGTIIDTRNLKDHTRLEILAYPLTKNRKPDIDSEPLGRFIAVHPGYLESQDYASGRQITLVGEIAGTAEGQIGEMTYEYPMVNVDQIYLWPRETAYSNPASRVHIGVGVGIGL